MFLLILLQTHFYFDFTSLNPLCSFVHYFGLIMMDVHSYFWNGYKFIQKLTIFVHHRFYHKHFNTHHWPKEHILSSVEELIEVVCISD